MERGWFGPKRMGWGVTVRSWKGAALVIAIVIAAAVAGRLPGLPTLLLASIWIALAVLLVVMVALTYKPDEPR